MYIYIYDISRLRVNSRLFGRGRWIKPAGISISEGSGVLVWGMRRQRTAITEDSTANPATPNFVWPPSNKLRSRHAPRQKHVTERRLAPLDTNHRNRVAQFQKCRAIQYTDHHNTIRNKIAIVGRAFARNHRTKLDHLCLSAPCSDTTTTRSRNPK